MSGYHREVGTASASSSASPKTATATCPSGNVLGGGFLALAPGGGVAEVTTTASYPSSSTVWTVTASEDNAGDVGNWSLQAFAICAAVAP